MAAGVRITSIDRSINAADLESTARREAFGTLENRGASESNLSGYSIVTNYSDSGRLAPIRR
jgi:hypothetical protein